MLQTRATHDNTEVRRACGLGRFAFGPRPALSATPMNVESERDARLAEIRQAIAAGVYETPERLEVAVDRLLDELNRPEGDHRPSQPR
jgi:hypothetical protein